MTTLFIKVWLYKRLKKWILFSEFWSSWLSEKISINHWLLRWFLKFPILPRYQWYTKHLNITTLFRKIWLYKQLKKLYYFQNFDQIDLVKQSQSIIDILDYFSIFQYSLGISGVWKKLIGQIGCTDNKLWKKKKVAYTAKLF